MSHRPDFCVIAKLQSKLFHQNCISVNPKDSLISVDLRKFHLSSDLGALGIDTCSLVVTAGECRRSSKEQSWRYRKLWHAIGIHGSIQNQKYIYILFLFSVISKLTPKRLKCGTMT